MTQDQRKWPRIPLSLDVQLKYGTVDDLMLARTVNVSREGLFIAMVRPKPIGTTVRVELSIREQKLTFQLEGVVVHLVESASSHIPAGVGVFLTEASAGWIKFCDELLDRMQEQAPDLFDRPI